MLCFPPVMVFKTLSSCRKYITTYVSNVGNQLPNDARSSPRRTYT